MAVGDGDDEAVEQLINTAFVLGSSTVDLSKKRIRQMPTGLLNLRHLEFLYLEGNFISSIPEELFDCLPSLRWLDLRNNRVSEVPPVIGKHRNLRNLLLEGNSITSLPLELGLVKSLSGLNLSGNPLVFPPAHVVERGTQEILKFLREQYLLHLQSTGSEIVDDQPESSSSEEILHGPPTCDPELTRLRMQEEQVENENNFRPERFKLPPIMQGATRPKYRAPDSTEGLLRGQKAKQFESQKPARTLIYLRAEREQKSPVKTVKQELRSPRKDAVLNGTSRLKDNKIQLEPLERTQRIKLETKGRTLELNTELFIVKNDDEGKAKVEKEKRKRKAHGGNPQKNPTTGDDSNKYEEVVSPLGERKVEASNHFSAQPRQIPEVASVEPEETFSSEVTLNEGDMVAIKVPEKLYIKGQPCLGKVTSLADQQDLLTVHYYTGSYQGRWRPMLSRTSPYLRKVPQADVLCKFNLTFDGRMSPITQRKLRTIIDERRK